MMVAYFRGMNNSDPNFETDMGVEIGSVTIDASEPFTFEATIPENAVSGYGTIMVHFTPSVTGPYVQCIDLNIDGNPMPDNVTSSDSSDAFQTGVTLTSLFTIAFAGLVAIFAF